MGTLTQLEPREVFQYFEQICSIPHGSGNEKQISDYLVNFAKERKLEHYQDAANNVVIIKEATPGYENEEPIILQGHMDMVAVQTADCTKDMVREGLDIAVDGDYVYAKGTSLGGDDGVAVAFSLALLDSKTLKHPRLEVIITTNEEVGMDGATALEVPMIRGHRMLNLDSEEEGYFLVSCAGGARVNCHLEMERAQVRGVSYQMLVTGLLGGHSGEMIIKGRGNSHVIAGRILREALRKADFSVVSLGGGTADNAIARETKVELLVADENAAAFEQAVKESEQAIKRELASKDPDFHVMLTREEEKTAAAFTGDSLKKLLQVLFILPNGVQAMSADVEGLPETSLNMGIMKTTDTEVSMHFSVRSSLESAKENLISQLFTILEMVGGSCDTNGVYPGWAFRKDSPMRDKMSAIYEEMFGEKPIVQALHAGLECGILASKINDLDCVSIGPNMKDIHTTNEKLSISSTKRMWEFVMEVISRK